MHPQNCLSFIKNFYKHRESSDLVFGTKSSTDGAANVAFPEEEESENGYIVPGKNEEDDKLLVTLLDILNSKGKNSIRSGFEDE